MKLFKKASPLGVALAVDVANVARDIAEKITAEKWEGLIIMALLCEEP
jgi:hypothetical protein